MHLFVLTYLLMGMQAGFGLNGGISMMMHAGMHEYFLNVLHMYAGIHVCIYVGMYTFAHGCMHESSNVCMQVAIYICMQPCLCLQLKELSLGYFYHLHFISMSLL